VEIVSVKQYKAVGGIIVSKKTGNVLTLLRSQKESYPGTWTFCGGKLESDEQEHEALLREIKEELGTVKVDKVIPFHRYQSRSKDFIYDTFIVLVDKEFAPTLNWENSGYAWTPITHLPSPLHLKTRQMLSNSRLIKKFETFCQWVDKNNGSRDISVPKKAT
jgi:8-oxo-dGTP pyrophosphatase MutT (NUDIX family)